jgi:indolepyruvate ferredoxin oxidoreductase, beta subunit
MRTITKSILLAGVGGQGILRASDILSMALMASGLDVKKSEVHGMAQRGGCVTSHVRYGEKVYSPIAKKGSVDILLSFEKLETLRYLNYMRPGARIIINEEELYPPSVNLGDASYPKDVVETTKKYFKNVQSLNAATLALRAGNIRTANTVMIGVVSRYMDVTGKIWGEILSDAFPKKLVAVNMAAFELGRSA